MIWFDVVFVPCQTGTSLDRVSQSNHLRSGPSTTTEKQRGYRANIRLDCEIIGPVTASSLACLETAFVQVRISISQCWGEATEIAPQSVRSVSSCMRKTNECVVMRSIRPPPAFSLTTSNLDSLSVLIPPVWKKTSKSCHPRSCGINIEWSPRARYVLERGTSTKIPSESSKRDAQRRSFS